MWIEVTSKKTGKAVLINTKYIQSVYPDQGENAGTVIDLGGYGDNIFVVEGSYKKIRDLVSEGEWTK